jgi:hypothetical protein
MRITFRDDDIGFDTDYRIIKNIHEQFLDHHLMHTASFLCKDLEKNIDLINYINKTKNWNFCVHGWTHKNYSLASKAEIEDEIDKCILKIDELFGKTPEVWYLPFNGWTKADGFDKVPYVADIAIYHGMDVDTDCDHINHFIKSLRKGEKPASRTVYFSCRDRQDLINLPILFYLFNNFKDGVEQNLQDLI